MPEPWERQRDESGRLEPIQAYEYFSEYLTMDKPRSMKVLCRILGKKEGYIRQLHAYSTTWNWIERAEAYDEHIILKKRLRKEQFYDELVESELPNLRKRLEFYNKNMMDIENDEKSKPTSKAHAYDRNSKAHSTTLNEIMLMIGKPTEIRESSLEADVRAETELNQNKKVEVDITSDDFMENELEFMRKMIEER